ncbi:MAG: dTDP-4-dehydrorhamnose reductase [Porphyromonadaceae bacterium]|nr:MAG: dTDP-4-dehydrorhamnose reductase [Porphyromonadaceae bacterium]
MPDMPHWAVPDPGQGQLSDFCYLYLMIKILLTGANGLVGQTLAGKIQLLHGFELLATSASDCKVKGVEPVRFSIMDITSPDQVNTIFDRFKPDVVIHCAALTQVDPCELNPDLCDKVNIEGTRLVAKAAEESGARFIYLSTDFVFDGLNGPYSEDDQPNPVSVYGWSKLQGEFITRSLKVPWIIVRTILVYGFTPSMSRFNMVTWVRDSLINHKPIRLVDDQFRMPTLVDDLADGIIRIIKRDKTGIYHLSGPEMTSVLDFAVQTARFFNLDESLISPVHSDSLNQPGRRPVSTGFILEKAIGELDYAPRNLNQGLTVARNLLSDYTV